MPCVGAVGKIGGIERFTVLFDADVFELGGSSPCAQADAASDGAGVVGSVFDIRLDGVIGAIQAEQFPEIVGNGAVAVEAVEINHAVPIGATVDVGKERGVGNHFDDVGIPFEAHEKRAFAQRGDEIALVPSTVAGRDGNFAVVNGRQRAIAIVVVMRVVHEPLGAVVKMIVLELGGIGGNPITALEREIVDVRDV